MSAIKKKPELLAPAGSIEAFHAAFRAGADAFYMGLRGLNARTRAKNFSREEMKAALLFARQHGKKIYITMNTLLYDEEIPEAVDTLAFLDEYGADGVIVQDLGLLSIISDHFPRLPVHASTQMFCHNSEHARFLKDCGISRIILPRELCMEEIRTIMEQVPLEYEIFIHGAMCFSFSGCCLFSSYLTGDSGNRGRCRQPCRYPGDGAKDKRYPFSMRDLSTADIMDELLSLGMSAFKIEGRLKSADYVYRTVSFYRNLIDSHAEGKELKDAAPPVTRETGTGYFGGWSYDAMVNDTAPGGVGELIGRVVSVSGTRCTFASTEPLRKGMKLRIADGSGRKVHEGTLLKFSRRKDNTCVWDTGKKFSAAHNLCIYHTGESAPSRHGEVLREAAGVKYIPARCSVTLDGCNLEACFGIESLPAFVITVPAAAERAEKQALGESAVKEIFRQVDRYPFDVRELRVKVPPGIFIPLSGLKRIRRDVYHKLMVEYERYIAARNDARNERILRELEEIRHGASGGEDRSLRYRSPHDAGGSGGPAFVEMDEIKDTEGIDPGLVLRIPLFVPEGSLDDVRSRLRLLINAGFRRFMAPTYGWVNFFRAYAGIEVFGGPMLYMVNSFAYRFMMTRGLANFTVSPDMAAHASTVSYRGYITLLNFPKELMATRLRLPEKPFSVGGMGLRIRRFRDYDAVYEGDI